MQSEFIDIKKITCILLLGFVLILIAPKVHTEKIRLPGKVEDFTRYIMYNYSATGEDLLFHLNELLLFEDIPTFKQISQKILRGINRTRTIDRYRGEVLEQLQRARVMTYSYKLPYMFRQHRVVQDYVLRLTGRRDREASFDLTIPEEIQEAAMFMKELGLRLTVSETGRFKVQEIYDPDLGVNQYFKIQGIDAWKLYRALNKKKQFSFKIKTFDLEIPFTLDFLTSVTGSVLKESNFVHQLVHDRRLQMLLGILFRLADAEIDYISKLAPDNQGWQEIYKDDKKLNGMFVLCHGLRVKDGRLRLQGGEESAAFWQKMCGFHPHKDRFKFILALLTKDNGKLNYFYTFGFFLEPVIQKEVFHHFEAAAFKKFYEEVDISKSERLGKALKLPTLDTAGIFSLFFAMQQRQGKIYFPGGITQWSTALETEEPGFSGILKTLAAHKKKKRKTAVRSFTAIYTKFIDCEELLTAEVLRTLIQNYDEYSGLVDFVEQLPIKKPSTVRRLFKWVKSFKDIKGSDELLALRNKKLSFEHARLLDRQGRRSLSTAVFQSLLAILSHGARYMPGAFDYDNLLEQMMDIQMGTKPGLYDGIMRFLDRGCGLDMDRLEADQSFMNFLLNGLRNQVITLHDEEYVLDTATLMATEINIIMKKQETCKLSDLVRVNELLNRLGKAEPGSGNLSESLITATEKLPLTDAENDILSHELNALIYLDKCKAPLARMTPFIRNIKEKVLLRQLKHLLVTGVYGLYSLSSNLRVYSNPYFTRLHDFTYRREGSPWNSCRISLGNAPQVLYHIEGGLSRLHIVLSTPFCEQLCRLERGNFTAQTTPIIYNNLDLFPVSGVGQGQQTAGILVQSAMDMLKKAETDEKVANRLKDHFAVITSGYHYRKIIRKLSGRQPKYFPYFRELLHLGEQIFGAGTKPPGDASWDNLEFSGENQTTQDVLDRLHMLGSVYINTFGRLRPYYFKLFPQSLSQLFPDGITGGEMNNELKIKAAYISYKRGVTPDLLGYLAYRYLVYVSMYYSQKFPNDFYKTYFVYDIYNHLYLNRILKVLKRSGILKIK